MEETIPARSRLPSYIERASKREYYRHRVETPLGSGFIHKVTRFARKRLHALTRETLGAARKDLKTRTHRNAYLTSVEDASPRGTFLRARFPSEQLVASFRFYRNIDFPPFRDNNVRTLTSLAEQADRISASKRAVLDLAFQSALTLQAWAELLRFRCCSVTAISIYKRVHAFVGVQCTGQTLLRATDEYSGQRIYGRSYNTFAI